ncbi:MAG: beta-N-acetylhexosaminidase [Hyphomicrobium sp.]|jgi:beta-N-acetylhexosaminidase
MRKAIIVGVAGQELSSEEASFLRAERPAGFILFSRNCANHEQIRRLVSEVKEAIGSGDVLILIDQEGGRVQRLRPPLGRTLPAAASYAGLYQQDPRRAAEAAFAAARLVAEDLRELGINTDCAPVLDVPVAGSHDIIGDRAFGSTPEQVATLGRAVAKGFLAGAVLPVIKHIPGHGRATADSHFDLPVVTASHAELSATDFAAFKALCDMPAAMTAHVVFTALDERSPASTSRIMTRDVIRGEIGFDGLLMSDDLSMKALSGGFKERAAAVIAAGSDLALHCNGRLDEMRAAAEGVPPLSGKALARFGRVLEIFEARQPFDVALAERHLADVLGFSAPRAESV